MKFKQWLHLTEAQLPNTDTQKAIKQLAKQAGDLIEPLMQISNWDIRHVYKDNVELNQREKELRNHIDSALEKANDVIDLISLIATEESGETPKIITKIKQMLSSPQNFIHGYLSFIIDQLNYFEDHGIVQQRLYRQFHSKPPVIRIESIIPANWINYTDRPLNFNAFHTHAYIHFTQDFVDKMFSHHMSAHDLIKYTQKFDNIADWSEVAVFGEPRELDEYNNTPTPITSIPGIPPINLINQSWNQYAGHYYGNEEVPDERGFFVHPNVNQEHAFEIPPKLIEYLQQRVQAGDFEIVNDFQDPEFDAKNLRSMQANYGDFWG